MFSLTDLVTALGWFGAVAGAAAYLLVSRGRWNASSARYQSANLLGAGLMGGVAAFNGVWPSAAANLIWVVIGGQALWVITAKKRLGREAATVSAADLEPRTMPELETPDVAAVSASATAYAERVLEERDPTLRMSVDELSSLTSRGVAAAA